MKVQLVGGVCLIWAATHLTSCVQTPVQETTRLLPPEERYDVKVAGGVLLDPDLALPPAEAAQEPGVDFSPKPVKKQDPKPQAQEETAPEEEDSWDETTLNPFDPESKYLSAIKNIIPTNPITLEKSDELTVPELLEALATAGDFNIVVAKGLEELTISRINFPNIPLRDAFIAVLKRYRLGLTRLGNVLFIDRANLAGDDLVYRVVRLSSISAESIRGQLDQILGAAEEQESTGEEGEAAVVQPTGYYSIHPASNTIFIRAQPEIVEAMVQFIEAVDYRGLQVLVEMKVFELDLDDLNSIGGGLSYVDFFQANRGSDSYDADWLSDFLFTGDPKTLLDGLDRIDNGDGTFTQSGPAGAEANTGLIRLNAGRNNEVQAFLDFLAIFQSADLLTSPRIAVVNGTEAEINVLDKLPYIQQTTTTGVAGETTKNEVKFEEVGIRLRVTPVIQSDRHIRMSLEPSVSESPGRFSGVPVINERTTKTEVIVADGESFAVGGLLKTKLTHTENKVPILGDIPLLKYFFSNTQDIEERLEILMLITPRILDDAVAGSILADQQLEKIRETRSRMRFKRKED